MLLVQPRSAGDPGIHMSGNARPFFVGCMAVVPFNRSSSTLFPVALLG